MMNTRAVAISLAVVLAQTVSENVRIDTYEKDGRRSGYLVINGRTGRIDQYTVLGDRFGYGTVITNGQTIQTYSNQGNRTGTGSLITTNPKR